MNDESPRNVIEPVDAPGPQPRSDQNEGISGAARDSGMPALGQYRSARPRAWWLTPVLIVLMVGAGAVWTVHGFLVRHDAEAKARRDTLTDTSSQGRVFKDLPASSADRAASAPASASTVANPATPASRASLNAAPARTTRAVGARSFYDAPLLAADAEDEPATGRPDGNASSASPVAIAAGGGGALSQALTATVAARVQAGMLGDRSLVLAQGAKIDCAGDTAFDSTEAGISTCTVTENVYSDDGRVVLIERGAQINSQYRSNLSPGQKRVFVLSARIETPQGVTVEIDSPAADALGRMGIDGYVNNHWGQRIGAAMLLGLTQDAIGYLSTRGSNTSGSVVYENTQQQGNDMATRVLDSTINIPPTLTQNQGTEFTIVVVRDLDFGSVYALQPEGSR